MRNLLAVKPNEKVLIVADTDTDISMVTSLASSIETVGAEYVITFMSSAGVGESAHTTLPGILKNALKGADIAIGLNKTTGAPSYDDTLAQLLREEKIRYMSMVMRSVENWTKGAATADYEQVHATAEKLSELFRGKQCKVTTPTGTEFTATIEGKNVIIEAGLARTPGESAAFPDGEISLGPIECSTNGTVVVDGPIAYLGRPDKPVTLEIEDGKVINVEGGSTAREVKDMISSIQNFDNFAEIGIGVNPKARKSGDWQEEKKKRGNVHIALGDNIYYGGTTKCDLHADFVIYHPTVSVDGKTIVNDGKLNL